MVVDDGDEEEEFGCEEEVEFGGDEEEKDLVCGGRSMFGRNEDFVGFGGFGCEESAKVVEFDEAGRKESR